MAKGSIVFLFVFSMAISLEGQSDCDFCDFLSQVGDSLRGDPDSAALARVMLDEYLQSSMAVNPVYQAFEMFEKADSLWDANRFLGAYQVMEEVEELARSSDDVYIWTFIARRYFDFNDYNMFYASLDSGTVACSSTESYIIMAGAWQDIDETRQMSQCLDDAAKLAKTHEEWLDVADAHYEYSGAEQEIRNALYKADELSRNPEEKRKVAGGFRLYLADVETADGIAPFGLSPNEIAKPNVTLPDWESDPAGLFTWLCSQVNQEVLVSIANADYGSGAERNLTMLQNIVRTELVPQSLTWNPREVLELTRWSQGPDVNHLERAFACAILCVDDLPRVAYASESNGIVLLESCVMLGDDAMSALLGLMVALVEGSAYEDREIPSKRKYACAAVYGLVLTAGYINPADDRLETLIPMLELEEVKALLSEGMSFELWQDLTNEIVPKILDAQPNSFQLKELGALVSK